MKIINETNLSYQYIGWIIDKLIEDDQGDTHYFGKVDYKSIIIKDERTINIQIRYLKTYTEFRFWEVK